MEFKSYQLRDICSYSNERIALEDIRINEYVSTENLLPNKEGKVIASSLPNAKTATKYTAGDTLISNIRPYFKKIWYSNTESGASADVLVFKPNGQKVNDKYLYYYLSQDKIFEFMVQTSKGTKMPRGDKTALMNYEIYLPSISMQEKIADFLSNIDDKIYNNNKSIRTLEQLAQTLFKHWFVDFEFPNENGDPYKSSGGEMVDSELGMIPAKWTIEKLGNVTEIQNGFAFKSKDYVKDGIKVLRTLNINSAGMIINNDDLKYLPQAFYSDDKYQKQQLERFDSLLVMVGSTIGKLGLVLSENLPSLQNQNMWRFRSKNEKLSNTILYFYLKEVIIATANWRSGSAREFFRKDTFSQYEIVMPDVDFLISNRNTFVKIFEQIDSCNSQNDVLNDLRDILLPKLLSGEIELPEENEVTDDVPIS